MSDVELRAARLATRARNAFGRAPAGVWAAPGRVNLLGEHTDYNDGFVLPVAVDREALAAVAPRGDGLLRCRSTDLPGGVEVPVAELAPGRVRGWPAYAAGVVWAVRELGVAVPGLEVLVSSDVPIGGGLSSSAALEASVALAIADLVGAQLTRTELARAAQRAETEVVGAPVGVMDQLAALLGRADRALLIDCRALSVTPLPLRLHRAGLRLVVIDTRVQHAHAGGEYARRRQTCQAAAARLGVPALRDATLEQVQERLSGELQRCARHVVTENARVLMAADLLRRGLDQAGDEDLRALRDLFAASHASMRDDFRISSSELDLAVETAGRGGALAARMTGGGFGGSAVAVVPDREVSSLAATVSSAFADAGFREPAVFPVQPSDGARRVL